MHSVSGNKICIVTDELAGPDYNGGIGTACHGLALVLAAAGFGVDVLYTRVAEGVVNCHRGSFESQVEFFARRGVRLLSLSHEGAWHDFSAKSFNALNHLQSQRYDFVLFNDTHGTGFYPLLSRRTGNPRLAETRMGVVTHSATQWILDLNGEPITGPNSVRVMEMERRSIELSDVVLSPSAYLIGKYKGYGWTFPAETHVRRYILPDSVQASRAPQPRRHDVDELVFFGRLERRKGIHLFCDALDRVKYALRGKTVSFLGKDTVVNGVSTLESIVARSAAWPFEVRVMQDFNRDSALRYLQGGRRVAVMPSLEDNSPCVIQECLELGIPFIASSGSGGEELIAEASRAHCCFVPNVTALSEKIRTVLEAGANTGELSFDPAQNERDLVEWLSRYLAGSPSGNGRQKRKPAPGGGKPAITLLVTGSTPLERSGAALRLRSLASAFGNRCQVAVVAAAGETPAGLAGAAAPTLSPAGYGAFAGALGTDKGHYVCIWDAGLDLNLDWLRRAQEYLSSAPDCAAVAGLATTGAPRVPREPPAHMSLSSVSPVLRQPIVGASDSIALLSQDSNNGFVLMRGAAFAAVRECLPWDEVYSRAKPADEWIDELLGRLRRQGRAVTLIPDLPTMPKGEQSYFEVFQRGAGRRAALASMPAFRPGAVDTLIHRLGIDKAADAETRQLAMTYLDRLAEQTRVPAQDWSSERGVLDPRLDQVVVAAFATGQIDLGKEILAYLASLKGARYFSHASRVEKFWEGLVDDIHLAIMLDRQDCWDSNQKTPPSLAVEGGERAILLHATRLEDGIGRLVFELDLTGFNAFSSSVRTLSAEDQQVRFHLAIASKQGPVRFGKDCLASGSAPVRFDCSVPDEMQGPCSVSLMAELRGEILSNGDVDAYWINPRFTRTRPG